MKKVKKILALLLTSILSVSFCSICAFATDSVEVSLKSSVAPAVNGEIYEVTLCVSDTTVGGVQGTLTYDSTLFKLNEAGGVTVTPAFAEANRLSENESAAMIKDDGAGTINFALLSDGTSTDWITFNFLVLGSTGKADFTLSNVKVSNAAGTARIATVTTESKTDVAVYAHAVDVNGASVRTDSSVDIRFEIELDKNINENFADVKIKKIGLVLIPTEYLLAEGKELTVDEDVLYSGKKAAIAERDVTSEDTIVYVNLTNSATDKNLNRAYTARAFVRLEDGTVIYSDNIVDANNIDNGMSSRSCVDVAKAVAESLNLTDTAIQEILVKDSWTLDEYKTVIKANNDALQNAN